MGIFVVTDEIFVMCAGFMDISVEMTRFQRVVRSLYRKAVAKNFHLF